MRPSPALWLVPLFGSVLYALWPVLDLPVFHYLPESGLWTWTRPPSGVAMKWFGETALALGAGALLGSALTPLVRRLPRAVERHGPMAAAVSVALSLTLITWRELTMWMQGH
ncbi:MAG: hypothetical protein HUU25_01415 [Candidatus Sumerlaeia bacterium]|nr:hypothetical protein [Candidatus Sumerlaeia bacterium]